MIVIVLAFAKLPNKSGMVARYVAFLEDSNGLFAVPVSSLVEEMCVLSRSSEEFKNGIKAVKTLRLYEEAEDVECWNIRYEAPQLAPKSAKRISEAPSNAYAASIASAAQLAAEKAADKKAKKEAEAAQKEAEAAKQAIQQRRDARYAFRREAAAEARGASKDARRNSTSGPPRMQLQLISDSMVVYKQKKGEDDKTQRTRPAAISAPLALTPLKPDKHLFQLL